MRRGAGLACLFVLLFSETLLAGASYGVTGTVTYRERIALPGACLALLSHHSAVRDIHDTSLRLCPRHQILLHEAERCRQDQALPPVVGHLARHPEAGAVEAPTASAGIVSPATSSAVIRMTRRLPTSWNEPRATTPWSGGCSSSISTGPG